MSDRKQEIAVYIPAYNVEKYLEKCIIGIKNQTYPVKEIYVIDDGCRDLSARIAQELGAVVLTQPENRGLAMGRRRAFEEINTEFIAALDADCVPEPDWLEVLIKEMDDPDIAGTSGKLIELYQNNPIDRWRHVHMVQHWGPKRIRCPVLLFGNNTLFRKTAVLECGNYPTDPRYRTNNEDYYISRRLRERGYQITYNPRAKVYHHRRDTVKSLFKTYWNWFFLHRSCPDSWIGVCRKTKENINLAAEFIIDDVSADNWDIITLDFKFLLYQMKFDLRWFFNSRHK